MSPEQTISALQLREQQMPLLEIVWQAWFATLPEDARATWRKGCVYVRESSAKSLAGSAAEMQLRNTLTMMANKKVFVPWEAVFFDNASGTDTELRPAFRRLYEEAIAGGFEVVGVFVSNRLFRNVTQATQVKKEFRRQGIEIEYLGKFEGDPRNPARWHMEVTEDVQAEMQARTTSFHVGSHFEALTATGHPVGRLPEVYVALEWAPSYMGHRGSATKWGVIEPLAKVVIEGKDLYLAGASYADLGRWAMTTVLEGKTPKGRWMNMMWWRTTLTNPKFAGYQVPSHYEGFKSGAEAPKPKPKRREKLEDAPPRPVMVVCKLPALWTLEEHERILATGYERVHSFKARHIYRSYLLAGITFDAACGSQMSIHTKKPNGSFAMACRVKEPGDTHTGRMRADIAEAELDELIGRLSLDDEVLISTVEIELAAIASREGPGLQAFSVNPAIAGVRRAIAELRAVGLDAADLVARVRDLEAADVARRDVLAAPVVEFRTAAELLREWATVWRDGDTETKNGLLRDAALHVVIGRDPGDDKGPAHLQSISAGNPVFELALSIALSNSAVTFEGEEPYFPSNVRVLIHVPNEYGEIVGETSVLPDGGRGTEAWLPRRAAPPRAKQRTPYGPRRPRAREAEFWGPRPGLEYMSVEQVAATSGLSVNGVRDWVKRSGMDALRLGRGHGKLFLLEADVRRRWPQDDHVDAQRAA